MTSIESMFCETVTPEVIEQLPIAVFPGEIIEVNSVREAYRAVAFLNQESLLGFDTETKPSFTPNSGKGHKTSLLQLATHDKAFLFRLHSCGITSRLAALLSNPKVFKVGTAVKEDIKGLQRYRTFMADGFIDLQSMTEPLGIKEKSLKKMAAIVLNLKLSKAQQLSNWDHKELTPAQRNYAALDAWICREIYLTLKK